MADSTETTLPSSITYHRVKPLTCASNQEEGEDPCTISAFIDTWVDESQNYRCAKHAWARLVEICTGQSSLLLSRTAQWRRGYVAPKKYQPDPTCGGCSDGVTTTFAVDSDNKVLATSCESKMCQDSLASRAEDTQKPKAAILDTSLTFIEAAAPKGTCRQMGRKYIRLQHLSGWLRPMIGTRPYYEQEPTSEWIIRNQIEKGLRFDDPREVRRPQGDLGR